MRKIFIVICVAVIVGAGSWYLILRPKNIRQNCAAQNQGVSNSKTHIKRADVNKFVDNAFSQSGPEIDSSYIDLQDSATTVYTGAYDEAYNACLHRNGL